MTQKGHKTMTDVPMRATRFYKFEEWKSRSHKWSKRMFWRQMRRWWITKIMREIEL